MCAILLWSSLVPTVLAIKRFMCVSKSRPSSRIILGARMCFIGQTGPWFDIPVWHTHLMHSFDGRPETQSHIQAGGKPCSFPPSNCMVYAFENIFHCAPRFLLLCDPLPYMMLPEAVDE